MGPRRRKSWYARHRDDLQVELMAALIATAVTAAWATFWEFVRWIW